ncbi:hypothetical protein H072_10512 [Dactylellina haptotyla CBS 200.50]|uniref:SPRY domain-containing protein n=1 Tax=Dactylellina haptotyla (strain CBS 200.50) TaxID=1284197 RepID=S8A4P4_DACHA|nr:hypothetical protein H072_10512 [Dactylellina haptotyla CBS 200.50]
MGLFSKLKGKDKQQDFSHLQGGSPNYSTPPPEDYSHLSSDNKGKSKKQEEYPPPSGAPPGYDFAPPGGPPPPSQHYHNYDAPPSGAPPGFDEAGGSSGPPGFHPWDQPTGPPPGYILFGHAPPPAPPVRSKKNSQGLNASEDDAEAGHQYCRQYQVYPPAFQHPESLDRINRGEVGLFQPANFSGHLEQTSKTRYKVHTHKDTQDTTLLSGLPLYAYQHHFPREKGYKTVYYEIKIKVIHDDSSIAIGFVNVPTPPFRLPGWHRGGLAVHSDDGNRYINDPYGGRTLTDPFREGETIGLGIRFRMGMAQAFLTRNGSEVKGSWLIDEPLDAEDTNRLNGEGSVKGLLGDNDLYAGIGVFGKVEFEVDFGYNEWQDSTIQL